jgi:hypothetical protein
LRTNYPDRDPRRLWKWYLQLQQAEAAFRTCKTDLGLRPIFRPKVERVEAHILVSVLSLVGLELPRLPRKIENEVPRIDPDKTQDPVDQDPSSRN